MPKNFITHLRKAKLSFGLHLPLAPEKKILDRACKKNDLRLSLVNIVKLYA